MQMHEWFDFGELQRCGHCGIIRRSDGKHNPCKAAMFMRPLKGRSQ